MLSAQRISAEVFKPFTPWESRPCKQSRPRRSWPDAWVRTSRVPAQPNDFKSTYHRPPPPGASLTTGGAASIAETANTAPRLKISYALAALSEDQSELKRRPISGGASAQASVLPNPTLPSPAGTRNGSAGTLAISSGPSSAAVSTSISSPRKWKSAACRWKSPCCRDRVGLQPAGAVADEGLRHLAVHSLHRQDLRARAERLV